MNYEWITEFKPITAKWHYTENELPEQGEELFCDTGDFMATKHSHIVVKNFMTKNV